MFYAQGDRKVHARIIDRRLIAAFSDEFVTAHWHARLPTSSDLPIFPPTSTLPLMSYEHIITIEADKRGGKPCIRGLRITVYDVLDYLAGGMTEQEILADFPDLTAEDLKACLAFAADRERRLYRTHAA